MGATDRPSFQLYPGDWRRDVNVQTRSLAARGLWFEMLCLMHDGEPVGHLAIGGKAISPKQLARLVGAPIREVKLLLQELTEADVYSVNDQGLIFSRRMVRDEQRRLQARENGRRGGNPQLIPPDKDGVNPPDKAGSNQSANQKPTPSSSSSSSSSASKKKEDSVPSERPAAPTPKNVIFTQGVQLIMAAGVGEDQARSFVGKLAKEHGDALALEVVAAAIQESPADPRAWLTMAAKQRAGGANGNGHFGGEASRAKRTAPGAQADVGRGWDEERARDRGEG